MKLGFIGAGFIARFHALAIQQVRGLEIAGLFKRRIGNGAAQAIADQESALKKSTARRGLVVTKAQRHFPPISRNPLAPSADAVASGRLAVHRALRGLLLASGLIASSMAFGAGPWFQGKFTGEEMLAHCKAADKDPIQDFGRGICAGFLDGFAAGHFVAETWHAFHHRDEKIDDIVGHLCVPEGTTRGQLARVYVQFLEKNPERLKLPAGLLLEDALRESYPCPK